MDETGITTAQKPDNVISRRGNNRSRGTHQRRERETTTTVVCCTNAVINCIPPIIFERKRVTDVLKEGRSTGE